MPKARRSAVSEGRRGSGDWSPTGFPTRPLRSLALPARVVRPAVLERVSCRASHPRGRGLINVGFSFILFFPLCVWLTLFTRACGVLLSRRFASIGAGWPCGQLRSLPTLARLVKRHAYTHACTERYSSKTVGALPLGVCSFYLSISLSACIDAIDTVCCLVWFAPTWRHTSSQSPPLSPSTLCDSLPSVIRTGG